MTFLEQAEAAGLAVDIAGDQLVVRGPRSAEPLVHKLLANKAAIMAELAIRASRKEPRSDLAGTIAEAPALDGDAELRAMFKAHASIHRHKPGYWRFAAEILAYDALIQEWHRRHPLANDPLFCAGCGQPLGHEVLERPDGAFVHHAYSCLRAHGEHQQARAVEALTALGIPPPAGWA